MTDLSTPPARAADTAVDRQDERLSQPTDLRGSVAAFVRRVRAGDLGALPVVVGLVIIWTVFQLLNPVFLSSNNLVNLSLELVSVGVIALGIVAVFVATPIYKADAVLQVDEKSKGNLSALKDLDPLLGDSTSVSAELEILNSRMILGRAVSKLNLDIVFKGDGC